MERIFLRRRERERLPETRDRIRIGVTGLGQGVGTTFVAAALAFYFRSREKETSYTECLDPACCSSLLYDKAAMDRRFSHRQFQGVYQLLTEDAPIKGVKNREEDIIWRLATPEDCLQKRTLTPKQQGRLLAAAKEDVCVFDMAADYQWDGFLMDMDVVFVVADPLPSRLIRSRERFKLLKKIELSGCKVIWVVNKVNEGVDKRQVKSYLKSEYVLWLEQMEPAWIYKDEFLCQFHWENEEIQRKLLEVFTKVSQFEPSLSWFSI